MTHQVDQDIVNFYLSQGIAVLPTVPNEKRPIVLWKDIASVEETSQLWPSSNYRAGIGILTGISNLLVVVAPIHCSDLERWVIAEEGITDSEVDKFINEHPVQCITPDGVRHLYFRLNYQRAEKSASWAGRRTLGQSALPGVHLIGAKGFIVAPPSELEGGQYEWVTPWRSREEIPTIPRWLYALMYKKRAPVFTPKPKLVRTPIPEKVFTGREVRIYAAGKISKDDWRDNVSEEDGSGSGGREVVDALLNKERILYATPTHRLIYVGPWVVGCDHSCFHGANSHGQGAGGCACSGDGKAAFDLVLRNALHQIRKADIVYVCLDAPDAYGTLAEIGYAHALNKPIILRAEQELEATKDLWFVVQMALNSPAQQWHLDCVPWSCQHTIKEYKKYLTNLLPTWSYHSREV